MLNTAMALQPEVMDAAALWSNYRRDKTPAARSALLSKYIHMVRCAVGRLKGGLVPSVDREDLESVASIGLVKAMDRFDPSRKVKFETYAYRWVQGSLLDYLRHLDALGRTSRQKVKRIQKVQAELRDTLGRDPTDQELCARLNMSGRELNRLYMQLRGSSTVSTDAGMDEDEGTEGPALPSPEPDALAQLESQEGAAFLKEAVGEMPEKERTVMSLYYYDDLSFKDIGRVLGVSESRVCQLHGRALRQLREGWMLYRAGRTEVFAAA